MGAFHDPHPSTPILSEPLIAVNNWILDPPTWDENHDLRFESRCHWKRCLISSELILIYTSDESRHVDSASLHSVLSIILLHSSSSINPPICDHFRSFSSCVLDTLLSSFNHFLCIYIPDLQFQIKIKMYASNVFATLLALSASVFAYPGVIVRQEHLEILRSRANTSINPSSITGTTCIDAEASVVFHGRLAPVFDFMPCLCYQMKMSLNSPSAGVLPELSRSEHTSFCRERHILTAF